MSKFVIPAVCMHLSSSVRTPMPWYRYSLEKNNVAHEILMLKRQSAELTRAELVHSDDIVSASAECRSGCTIPIVDSNLTTSYIWARWKDGPNMGLYQNSPSDPAIRRVPPSRYSDFRSLAQCAWNRWSWSYRGRCLFGRRSLRTRCRIAWRRVWLACYRCSGRMWLTCTSTATACGWPRY